MEIRALDCFVRVAELGSVSRAAEQLGIVQPALSRHIQRLEDELGVPLFLRVPRGMRLTPAGRQLLEHATQILRQADDAKRDIVGGAASAEGRVALGVPGSLAPLLVPQCLERFQRDVPKMSVHVAEGPSTLLHDRLRSGHIDLAVLTNLSGARLMNVQSLVTEPMVLVGSKPARDVKLADVVGQPLWVTGGIRAIVEAQIRQYGKRLRIAGQVDSVETIRRLLLRGSGTSLLPVSVVHQELASRRLFASPIRDVPLVRLMVLAHASRARGPRPTEYVATVVRQEMKALVDGGLFTLPGR